MTSPPTELDYPFHLCTLYHAGMASRPDMLMPAQWELASQLKTMRDAADLSAAELGTRIGKSQSHVSRWESAKVVPKEVDVRAVCDALGVGPDRLSRMLVLLLRANQPDGHGPAVNKELSQLMAFEDHAISITQVSPLLVPGVLQTADYARSIMRHADLSDTEVEKRVAVRGQRQEMILSKGTRFEVLIADRALEVGPCPDEVLRDQLKQLVNLTDGGTVTVRRVRMGGHYTGIFSGAFLLLRFANMTPVGHVEVHHYSSLLMDRRDVAGLERAISECRDDADSAEETRRHMEGLIRG